MIGSTFPRSHRWLWPLAVAGALSATNAHAGLGTAVEYYNPTLRHYFVTANPAEAAMLDAGNVVKGWKRTGGEFSVYTEPGPDRAAVCRFFGTPGKGPNSHFYTADPAECAKVKTLPAWTFEEVAFHIPLPVNGACTAGATPIWRSFFSDQISDVNHRFTADLTAYTRMTGQKFEPEGLVMCAPQSSADVEADIVRLLEQATLGPTEALVQQVKAQGMGAWLEQQLTMNVTRFTQWPVYGDTTEETLACSVNDPTPPATPEKYCVLNKMTPDPVAFEFFRQAKTAPDQLRLRMAHIWQQIFVVVSPHHTYPQADFHQRLRDHALGTFEDLLRAYALSPQLGFFQNWVYNRPEHDGIKPNENFARELMQLFSIGPNMLNDDGTPKLDAQGQFVPSYGQPDIESLARVLTGFTYKTRPGITASFFNPPHFLGEMIPFEQYHDAGAKTVLDGRLQLPAGMGALQEVQTALRALVDHPNTPGFIGKQLIQKMVTSSPTPEYVGRVAAVFRDNGNGMRGDLAAVVRAVLLDPEARGARKIDRQYGRLREPVLFWTAMLRALDATTDGVAPFGSAASSGQKQFGPPSVFGYYPADFTLAGSDIPAPEFGIFTSAELMNRANQVSIFLHQTDQSPNSPWKPQGYIPNPLGTPSPPLTAFLADAANTDLLVERMNRLFLHGTMRPAMRKSITNAVVKVAASDPLNRVRLALYLTLASIDYQVQK